MICKFALKASKYSVFWRFSLKRKQKLPNIVQYSEFNYPLFKQYHNLTEIKTLASSNYA